MGLVFKADPRHEVFMIKRWNGYRQMIKLKRIKNLNKSENKNNKNNNNKMNKNLIKVFQNTSVMYKMQKNKLNKYYLTSNKEMPRLFKSPKCYRLEEKELQKTKTTLICPNWIHLLCKLMQPQTPQRMPVVLSRNIWTMSKRKS